MVYFHTETGGKIVGLSHPYFALNCGSKSCPPIAYYSAEKNDIQLDQATRTFLKQETVMAYTTQEIRISKIFYWYYGDFGGKGGIHELLEKYCLESSVRGGETGPNSTSEHDKTAEAGVTRDFRLVLTKPFLGNKMSTITRSLQRTHHHPPPVKCDLLEAMSSDYFTTTLVCGRINAAGSKYPYMRRSMSMVCVIKGSYPFSICSCNLGIP